MKTFYDILNVSEEATFDEINNAYNEQKRKYESYLLNKFDSDKVNQRLKQIEIAYKILANPQSKIDYDKKLSSMRANELIDNLNKNTISHNQEIMKKEQEQKELEQKKIEKQIKLEEKAREKEEELKKKEKIKYIQNQINKQIEEQQKKFKLEEKQRKKMEEAKADAYRSYLRSMGVDVKTPITIKKVIKTIIATIIVFGIVILVLNIPVVKNAILENEGIKTILNLFV